MQQVGGIVGRVGSVSSVPPVLGILVPSEGCWLGLDLLSNLFSEFSDEFSALFNEVIEVFSDFSLVWGVPGFPEIFSIFSCFTGFSVEVDEGEESFVLFSLSVNDLLSQLINDFLSSLGAWVELNQVFGNTEEWCGLTFFSWGLFLWSWLFFSWFFFGGLGWLFFGWGLTSWFSGSFTYYAWFCFFDFILDLLLNSLEKFFSSFGTWVEDCKRLHVLSFFLSNFKNIFELTVFLEEWDDLLFESVRWFFSEKTQSFSFFETLEQLGGCGLCWLTIVNRDLDKSNI